MGWTESGQPWGARARDWAYLVEPLHGRLTTRCSTGLAWAAGRGCSMSPAAPDTPSASLPAAAPRSPGWMRPKR